MEPTAKTTIPDTLPAAYQTLTLFLDLKSDNTRRKYLGALNALLEEYGRDLSPDEAEKIAAEYARRLMLRPAQPGRSRMIAATVSKNTVKQHLISLHVLWTELVNCRACSFNPWTALLKHFYSARGNDRRPHKVIDFGRVRELLEVPAHTHVGKRNKAILAILFGGALRRSEAVGLRIQDITEEVSGTVLVLRATKTGEAARQPIPEWCSAIVYEYLACRRLEDGKPEDPFLVQYAYGRPKSEMDDRTLARVFNRVLREAGLEGYTPHDARATVITRLRKQGLTYEEILPFSRHSSVKTVQRYDKLILSEAGNVAKKLTFND